MILYADSFEHYGTGAAAIAVMKKGAYSALGASIGGEVPAINSALARTGSKSLYFTGYAIMRVNLPGGLKRTFGFGMGINLVSAVPQNKMLSNGWVVFGRDNVAIVSITINADGALNVYRGSVDYGVTQGPLIGQTDGGLIVPGTFTHVEVKLTSDPLVGRIEIRVNGIEELVIADQNFRDGASQILFGNVRADGAGGGAAKYIDDLVLWDEAGGVNDDFLGPVRVLTLWADGVGSENEWGVVGAASSHLAINQTAPDDDTSYIQGEEVGDAVQLTIPDLPPETTTITGVYVPLYGKLEEAGIGRVQVGLANTDGVSNGAPVSLVSNYSYRGTAIDRDPNGEPWTKASLEAAQLRLVKVD